MWQVRGWFFIPFFRVSGKNFARKLHAQLKSWDETRLFTYIKKHEKIAISIIKNIEKIRCAQMFWKFCKSETRMSGKNMWNEIERKKYFRNKSWVRSRKSFSSQMWIFNLNVLRAWNELRQCYLYLKIFIIRSL